MIKLTPLQRHAKKAVELQEKHAKELAAHNLAGEVLRALPPSVDYELLVCVQSNHVSLMMRPKNLREAMQILDLFEPVETIYARNTYLHFGRPAELIGKKELENPTEYLELPAATVLRISRMAKYQSEAKLSRWTRLNGVLAEVQLSLGLTGCFGQEYPRTWHINSQWYPAHREGRDHVEGRYVFAAPAIKADKTATWGTGATDSAEYSWLWFDTESFNHEMRNHLPQEETTPSTDAVTSATP